jgi:hypothetical protein
MQRLLHFPAAIFAFNSSNQLGTTIMLAGALLPLEPVFADPYVYEHNVRRAKHSDNDDDNADGSHRRA